MGQGRRGQDEDPPPQQQLRATLPEPGQNLVGGATQDVGVIELRGKGVKAMLKATGSASSITPARVTVLNTLVTTGAAAATFGRDGCRSPRLGGVRRNTRLADRCSRLVRLGLGAVVHHLEEDAGEYGVQKAPARTEVREALVDVLGDHV